jgi:hypothetical protein
MNADCAHLLCGEPIRITLAVPCSLDNPRSHNLSDNFGLPAKPHI